MKKNLRYLVLLAVLIFFGLGSRAYTGPYDASIHLYVGDVLYTTMYYLLFRWIRCTPVQALLASVFLCFGIETLQLYKAPWIQEVRANRLGKLVLGNGFVWSDFVCYTLGGFLGYGVEYGFSEKQNKA